jgi:hypothetical protein
MVLFTSCYSYKIYPKEFRSFEYSGEKKIAFITNPELKAEYNILKKSKVYIIANDSLDVRCVKIRLHPIKRSLVCGQPIIASLFTLGQLPVYFPDKYQYQFDEIDHGKITSMNFELHVAQRFWFWDMFTFDKNFNKKAGKALLACYYKK